MSRLQWLERFPVSKSLQQTVFIYGWHLEILLKRAV